MRAMSEALTENIKTRVPPWVKRGFKRIAKDRHLKASDIHREAFREYLKSREVMPNAFGQVLPAVPPVVNREVSA